MGFPVTGGARIGWVNASWPLAKLSASPVSLELSVRLLGDYSFAPAQVVALEPYGVVPRIGRGIRIVHAHPEHPTKIVFWVLGGQPEALVARIREAGFVPSCPAGAVPPRSGPAFRWSALAAGVLLWNVLFVAAGLFASRTPRAAGPFALLALGLAFLAAWSIPRSARLQSLVLRPGRAVGEIRAFLSLLQLICGLLFVFFAVAWLAVPTHAGGTS